MGFLAGHTGQIILRDLLARGVSTNFVWIDGENRTNVALIVQGREYHPIHIHEEGPPIPQEAVEIFLRKYDVMLRWASFVVLAGILAPGLTPNFYRELARRAREKGVKVVVHAGGEALVRTFGERPFLVKPDVREAPKLGDLPVRTKEEILVAGKEAIAQGVELCLVSYHLTGDILISKDEVWEFEARVPLSTFRNLVCADDALVGGILVGLTQGMDLIESVRYGMAAAVASAKVDEKLCLDRKQIAEEMNQIEVRHQRIP